MQPFPAEHELIWLFESEPAVKLADVPWAYNELTFVTVRGPDTIRCVIEPGYQSLDLSWERDGLELVALALRRVRGIEVDRADGGEALVVTFAEPGPAPLRLTLKPRVHLTWGTRLYT
jgi:hypothetical protein